MLLSLGAATSKLSAVPYTKMQGTFSIFSSSEFLLWSSHQMASATARKGTGQLLLLSLGSWPFATLVFLPHILLSSVSELALALQ